MTGTDLAFDLDALVKQLEQRGHVLGGPLVVDRVGHGQSNLTYAVMDSVGQRCIVRRPPRGHLLASAHDVQREARILSALSGTPVPVPDVLLSTSDAAVADAPVVVLEHVDGTVVDTPDVAMRLGPLVRAAIGPDMASVLASIHAVDLVSVGLDTLASHAPYAQRQLKRWSAQWVASRTRESPALDEMTELLARTAPTQRETVLVHGDFHVRNVILQRRSGQVRAVLDWELSTLGDPLADLGTMLAYWGEWLDPATGLFDGLAIPGYSRVDQVGDAYAQASGRDVADVGYWHALGLWKMAIIAEGVVRRVVDDPSNAAAGGPPSTEAVDRLIDRSWTIARESGLLRR